MNNAGRLCWLSFSRFSNGIEFRCSANWDLFGRFRGNRCFAVFAR